MDTENLWCDANHFEYLLNRYNCYHYPRNYHDTTITRSLYKSTIGNSSVDNSNTDNSSIGNSSIGNISIGNSSVDNSSVDNSTIGNSSVDNNTIGNSTIGNSSIGNSTIGNSTIGNSSIGNSSIGNRTTNIYATIPKVIHFIWLGSQLPTQFATNVENCRAINSTWSVKLWTDETVSGLELFNKSAFERSYNYGMKSDILRYEILYQYGGVYVDIDNEFVQSLDTIIDSSISFIVGKSNTKPLEINNSLIGCTVKHSIIDTIRKRIHNTVANELIKADQQISIMLASSIFLSQQEQDNIQKVIHNRKISNTIILTGPGLLTKVLYEYLLSTDTGIDPYRVRDGETAGKFDESEPQCVLNTEANSTNEELPIKILPIEYLSPAPNTVSVDKDIRLSNGKPATLQNVKDFYVTSKTVAIHWWAKSWC